MPFVPIVAVPIVAVPRVAAVPVGAVPRVAVKELMEEVDGVRLAEGRRAKFGERSGEEVGLGDMIGEGLDEDDDDGGGGGGGDLYDPDVFPDGLAVS